jgi:putative phosphoribosyl transferase
MPMTYRRFQDRREAGHLLAEAIAERRLEDPVVLGLPRGGVVLAAEVAKKLDAPLDIILVRKLGAPLQPELAIGAVIDGAEPQIVLNPDVVRLTDASEDYIREEVARQVEVIEARRRQWIAGRPRVPIAGKTAIVVDDGIATGATMRASLQALRRQQPKKVVVATPVAARETVEALKLEADEVICLLAPDALGAIGFFYRDFSQVSDEEVTEILRQTAREDTSANVRTPQSNGRSG